MALVDQIELLVGQATRTGLYYDRKLQTMLDPKAYVGLIGPGAYVAKAGEVSMISEPAALLQQLYAAADPSQRHLFPSTLVHRLGPVNARVVARTLAATGNVSAIHHVERLGPDGEELWRGLIHVLRFESPLFTEADLRTVELAATALHARGYAEALEHVQQVEHGRRRQGFGVSVGTSGQAQINFPLAKVVEEVTSVISRIRYLRLAKAIRERQNPALDADRQILLSRLQAMGFSAKLSSASDEIERRAAVATTEMDVKAVMDLLRTFYEEFIEEACHKVEARVEKAAPAGPNVDHFGPYRQYLRDHDFIGLEEDELLGKLYRFLSNQGTHKLGSAPEQLRVAHATVVEWCMLIAGRINKYLT